jgi:hypothetical protein
MPVKPRKLTPNERRFCIAYVGNGRNASAAYRETFPAASDRNARQQGYAWTHRPDIVAEIDRLTEELLTREHMTTAETLAQMARIARSDIGDLVWKPGELNSAGQPTDPGTVKALFDMPERVRMCIKSLKWDLLGRPEFTFWSKDSALTNIGKHLKLLNESVDVNVQVGFAEKLRAAREKRLKGLKR